MSRRKSLSGNYLLNKPVVVSEEALVAPVTVPDLTSAAVATKAAATGPAYIVLGGISLSHFLNDTMQSLIPSVYPILKASYALDFAQIGLITLAFQFTASLLQPVIRVMGEGDDRILVEEVVDHIVSALGQAAAA